MGTSCVSPDKSLRNIEESLAGSSQDQAGLKKWQEFTLAPTIRTVPNSHNFPEYLKDDSIVGEDSPVNTSRNVKDPLLNLDSGSKGSRTYRSKEGTVKITEAQTISSSKRGLLSTAGTINGGAKKKVKAQLLGPMYSHASGRPT